MSTPANQRLTPELLKLMEHESAIERHLGELGWHLMCIRDGRLYRARGFDGFEDYCLEWWRFRRNYADRMIAGARRQMELAEVVPRGTAAAAALETAKEKQLRPLAPLDDDPEAQAAAWVDAVEQADGEQPSGPEVAAAVARQIPPPPVTKRDLGGGISHPARYPSAVLEVMADLLAGRPRVLDPFAGTGRIHELAERGWDTLGIEIEPEWAALHERTRVGNALALKFRAASFDAIATSPTYGNRMADHHDAYDPQTRHTYRHDLGRELDHDNSGAMQWGDDYRAFHRTAWSEAVRVLRPGGRFVLNIKDHIRGGKWQDVAGWHLMILVGMRLRPVAVRPVAVAGRLDMDNAKARASELVIALDKP